jgi:hypothetical protein
MIRPPTSLAGEVYRPAGPMLHNLKTWPEFYTAIEAGEKTFDIRKDDRGFKVGDFLLLFEYLSEEKTFTGRVQFVEVTYVLKGGQWGIVDGYVILGIKICTAEQAHQTLAEKGDPE